MRDLRCRRVYEQLIRVQDNVFATPLLRLHREVTEGRLGIEFAWLITDEDGLTFSPRPLCVSDHDAAGEIHRRRMEFLYEQGVKHGRMKMEEKTNDEIRGRRVSIDLDEPLLCEKELLYVHEELSEFEISLMDDVPDTHWTPLRLKVHQTSILHRNLSLAVLDAYTETQFGRDVAPPGSDTPRVRLKEMPVSKLHATVFWDKDRREWAVVDMGSKHGTFIQSALNPDAEPVRLSPSRMASVPRPLRHLDRLIIGSTTFLCHIHEDRIPCADCTSTGQGVIPLFAVPKEGDRTAEKRASDVAGIAPTQEARDVKKALTSLRRTLLSRLDPHDEHPTPTQPSASYVDRSARRRAMHPTSQFDSPGVQSPRSSSPGPVRPSRELSQTPSVAAVEDEHPPIAEQNIGRRLLMKQGWQPGTSLGVGDGGLVEPIEVQATAHRAGIGMVHVTSLQESRERRWERVQ